MKPMFTLPFYATVQFHPYRTARVSKVLFSIDARSADWQEFVHQLIECHKRHNEGTFNYTDNHVVFGVKHGDSTIYFQISDYNVHVGTDLLKGYW